MGERREEYPLDVYKLRLGAFVLLSPWLFALTYGPARLKSVVSGAVVIKARTRPDGNQHAFPQLGPMRTR